jgi:hypothetical protein
MYVNVFWANNKAEDNTNSGESGRSVNSRNYYQCGHEKKRGKAAWITGRNEISVMVVKTLINPAL